MKGTASHACPPSMFDGSELTWFESHKFMSLDGLGQVSLNPSSYGCQEQTSAEIAPKESCAHILWGLDLSSLRRCQLGRGKFWSA